MAGYTHKWDCWICEGKQDTIDHPLTQICDECLTPLAKALCQEELGVKLTAGGVDQSYWMRKAHNLAIILFTRKLRNKDAL